VKTQTHFPIADYLFVGAGASATLLLMSMENRGLLKDKKVVVIDPDAKNTNDKTYCFWSNPNEPIAQQCGHLISYQWDRASIGQNQPQSLSPLNYVHLSSIDLYGELHRIISDNNIQRIHGAVLSLETSETGVRLTTENGNLYAQTVFDSRTPQYLKPKTNEAHLLQSFMGYVIETKTPLVDASCINLMDFDVEQLGSTQFVYVLPFGEHKLLVELTRFGELPITQTEGEPILREYITQRFGSFSILDTETGVIPMSSAQMKSDVIPGVILIGGKAGAVKPSTGYAFKNMFRHAESIANSILQGIHPATIKRPNRFPFYDRLLLYILQHEPHQGKPIFQTLFKNNKLVHVLRFLDEKTSITQDVRLLASLPFKPFLKALRYDISARYQQSLMPLLVLLLSLGMWLLFHASPTVFNWVEPVLFLVGLLIVGIPHGAVDHLLESGQMHSRPSLFFMVQYLGAALLYFLGWLLFPVLAISLFLLYSMWHFGQNDMNQWQPLSKSTLNNWIWGFTLLGILICGHVEETNIIFEEMEVYTIPLTNLQGNTASIILIIIAMIWGLWKGYPSMILSSCMLAIGGQLPLITAFGLYFIGQHSVNGWSHLKQGLSTDNATLFLKALPFSLGAFLLFSVLLVAMQMGWLKEFSGNWLTAFFVFVSCISFPHVIAMHQFYKKHL
jgi:lycopene beta-cyclase